MKTKYLLLGIVTLLAMGAWWVGRAAWRANHELVSLDMRNAPLLEVLRKVERQSWKKIRAEQSLANLRVTLRVTDKPLDHVLDRLAEQVSARWSTVYAVYDSSRALKALDSALRADGKIESAGWTKIAPNLPDFDKPGANETDPSLSSDQVEMWSPEELVIESLLRPRLGDDRMMPILEATGAAAAETARKLNGRWTTYLAFRKSGLGVGFGAVRTTRARLGQSAFTHGRNADSSQATRGENPPDLNRAMQGANPNQRFGRLTPEQRVQRARDRQQTGRRLELRQK